MRRLAALALLLAACATPIGEEQSWSEVETEHVRLFSSRESDLALEVAERLELFHRLGRQLLGERTLEERTPTKVYLLDDAIWFGTLRASLDLRGVLVPAPHANYLAAPLLGSREKTLRWAQNAYVRVLQQTTESRAYPRWYEIGIGELLSSIEVRTDDLRIGRIPRARRTLLERGFAEREHRGVHRGAPQRVIWVPLRTVMTASDIQSWPRHRRHMFQAESWALVFYLSWERPEALARYLELVGSGRSHDEAFEVALGGSHFALEEQLERFLRGRARLWRLPRGSIEARVDPRLSRLAPHVWLVRVGDLLIARRLPEQAAHAQRAFEGALADAPDLAEAHAGLAAALGIQSLPGGDAHIERALALAPQDAQLQRIAGEYYLERLRVAGHADPELLARARAAFERALELASALPAAHYGLGLTHLLPGEDPRQAIAPLERAHARMPWQRDIALALGEAHLRAGDAGRARELLTSVARGTHRDRTRQRAEELLAQLGPSTPAIPP